MSGNLETLDVGQANEMKLAFRRTGWTNEEIKRICEGNILADFHDVVIGKAEIKLVSPQIRPWIEEDNTVSFPVTSDGTTGPDWIKRLEQKGFRIGDYAKSILKSNDFKPTNGVTTTIVVLKGMLWSDTDRTTKNIRAEAEKRGLVKPNAEVACLIREKFSDDDIKAMGLIWIVAMHDPIKDSGGLPSLLGAGRDAGGSWLDAGWDRPGRRWSRRWNDSRGFAFAVSQG